MKIAIDAREIHTSSGRYVEKLIKYLQVVDGRNHYDILLKTSDFAGWNPSNQNFNKQACPSKEFTFTEQTALLAQVKSLKADLVHFTFPQQPILYKGKAVTTIHDLTTLQFTNPDKNIIVYKFKQKVFAFVIKRVAQKSEKVIVPSQFVKDELIKFTGVNPAKIVVTYEAADTINEASEPLKELTGEKFIMYVGRPTPHKNLERLVEAFALLKKTHPELKLVLAGKKDRNYGRLESWTEKCGYTDIFYTGFISEGQLKWLYQNCQAYVFPSLSEGFGLPGLEAMLCGAAVVSSNASCLPEVYGDGAVYFDPKNVPSIAKSIGDVLDDDNLRSELINKGKARVANYSWERMAKQTLAIYKEVLGE